MVNGIVPPSLGVVFPPPFPVLGVNQMDLTVIIGHPCGLSPVNILEPFNTGLLGMIKTAEIANGFIKLRRFVFAKKGCELTIYQTSFF